MAFMLPPDTLPVTSAIRALAQTELTAALHLARAPAADLSPLHALRKRIKKTRGLLRLVAPVFPDFDSENIALREAALGISGLRDAEVLHVTLARLTGENAAGDAARTLAAALPPPVVQPDPQALAEFAAKIEAVLARLPQWRFEAEGWEALAPGLTRTLHQAQRRMKTAAKKPSPEHLHAWRSRVKHHWYHARLLTPIWPEVMGAHVSTADALGEMLGDHHDLCVLQATLPGPLSPEAAQALGAAIATRKATLEARAFAQGARLLAEPPEALATRWGKWYALWREDCLKGGL
ncbi:CHAD domain-containing protein [Rhodobacter maris]|uniref:CHAD domain-containing protein n=1 Tax=Rhodobacter maris TaxID=446682 RepID=A0A285RIK3_9RHOB|nr:CHAD domain-containing protein [Rhodobacter maris]SOB93911.1 CHAD domain-containing protein [Rhodobacter maris]